MKTTTVSSPPCLLGSLPLKQRNSATVSAYFPVKTATRPGSNFSIGEKLNEGSRGREEACLKSSLVPGLTLLSSRREGASDHSSETGVSLQESEPSRAEPQRGQRFSNVSITLSTDERLLHTFRTQRHSVQK